MRNDLPHPPGIETAPSVYDDADEGIDLFEVLALVRQHAKLLTLGPLAAGLVALGIAFVIPPTFTATTTFLPPQQHQGGVASVLSQLGPLAGLAGAAAGVRTPADQYVALMHSVTVSDRIVDQFKLMQEYDEEFRVEARKELAKNVRITVGKKDGLITVEVDDKSPQRAAEMANQYVSELRRMTSTIAVSEAQQRRVFFEHQLQETKGRLTAAQEALRASGFDAGAIKAEPKAAAEGYARLRAEVTAAEVRLQAMRGSLADDTPEVRQQQAMLTALRGQLARLEQSSDVNAGPDYVGKYREFKYQETLFDLFARQYELARVDESREGALIQVVDVAQPPERKSRPKRGLVAVVTTLATAVVLLAGLLMRDSWRRGRQARESR
ncbi:MAG: lipopolysaccharide biosynthesis protein [Ideonella sp.]|nr:lipopolysaccharide biosynthesis protein [Ideonella sp.]MCC7456911.1 hypothetical protein [Nitrospira sp.]